MSNQAQIKRTLGLAALDPLGDMAGKAKRLDSILDRLGSRLLYALREGTGVPDEQWVEAFRYYQAAVCSRLKEERERARERAKDRGKLSDAELDAQIKRELTRALDTMTPEERAVIEAAMAATRKVDDRTVS